MRTDCQRRSILGMNETNTRKRADPSLPVLLMSILGTLITVLGFFAGGNVVWVVIGLGTVFAAGIIGLLERLIESRTRSS